MIGPRSLAATRYGQRDTSTPQRQSNNAPLSKLSGASLCNIDVRSRAWGAWPLSSDMRSGRDYTRCE